MAIQGQNRVGAQGMKPILTVTMFLGLVNNSTIIRSPDWILLNYVIILALFYVLDNSNFSEFNMKVEKWLKFSSWD